MGRGGRWIGFLRLCFLGLFDGLIMLEHSLIQFDGFGNQGIEVGNACSNDKASSNTRFELPLEIVNLVVIGFVKDRSECFEFGSKSASRTLLLEGIIFTTHLFHVVGILIER